MCENIRTVYKGGEGEYEEKKSRFIAHVTPVKDADEAAAFINSIKKQYWDARHNCSAFIVGERGELIRSSDDGEPSGTAGKPILELLKSERLTGVCVVVTRYFGGVLLGTGGLIRALTQAREVFANAIRKGACGVILAHNHPSGDPEPSKQDLDVTKQLVKAGKILGIGVVDHIVIGDGRYVSFADRKLL